MAFNLKLVLKALLFSSSQALSIKDIQGVLARFHEQAGRDRDELDVETRAAEPAAPSATPKSPSTSAEPLSADDAAGENTAQPSELSAAAAPSLGETSLEVPAETVELK